MNEKEEAAYLQGRRAAVQHFLNVSLNELGYTDPAEADRIRWISEREDLIAQLRILCRDFGDNEWDEKLSLADVIDKHLGKHLHQHFEPINPESD